MVASIWAFHRPLNRNRRISRIRCASSAEGCSEMFFSANFSGVSRKRSLEFYNGDG